MIGCRLLWNRNIVIAATSLYIANQGIVVDCCLRLPGLPLDKRGAFCPSKRDFRIHDSVELIEESENGLISKGQAWTGGRVPFRIVSGFTTFERKLIRDVAKNFAARTHNCIRWEEINPRKPCSNGWEWVDGQQNTCGNYVVILKTDEDCSVNSVGMRGGVQRIKLGGSCMSYKGIQHEMLHALGVEHEHQRPDRDNYVTVLWNNIQLDRVNDFHKKDVISYGPYDYDSIMHYSTCGANKGRETIMRKGEPGSLGRGAWNGRNYEMTWWDVKKLERMYDC